MGSVDPARDFCTLIKQKTLPFGDGEFHSFLLYMYIVPLNFSLLLLHLSALVSILSNCVYLFFCLVVVTLMFFPVCQQLTHRIEQLLSNKNTHYYMKSITCIQAFREQSVKVNKHKFHRWAEWWALPLLYSLVWNNLKIFWLCYGDYESTYNESLLFLPTWTEASSRVRMCAWR